MSIDVKLGTEVLDHINHYLQQSVSAAVRHSVANLDIKHIPVMRRSCIACMHFNEQNEVCSKFQARPPARIIAFACPEYVEDTDIPF